MKNIKKVKWNRKEKNIKIDWEIARVNSENDEFSIKCRDEARPEFYKAFQVMAKHWSGILELNHEDSTEVSTISFSRSSDVMGVTVYASLRLQKSTGVWGCNTPHRIEEFYSKNGGDEGQLMSPELIRDCKTLLSEAERYIDGDRAQLNMFHREVT